MFQICFIILILLVPIFSKPFHEASTNLLQDWIQHIDGASFSFLMTMDQPVMQGMQLEMDEQEPFYSFLIPLFTSLPYKDIRLLFGHELPQFPLTNSTIAVAGDGTNMFTTTIESSPPDHLLVTEPAEPEEEVETPQQPIVGDESIFIYTTHNREAFLPHLPENTPTNEAFHQDENVMKLSNKLYENLKEYGLNAYVDQTDYWQQIIQDENVEYHHSYDLSRAVIQEVMTQNEEVKYLLDIHRDAQPRSVTTTEVNGESVAKLMFVVGGEHDRYEENLQFAIALHQLLEEKYPGVSRGVDVKEGRYSNGIYNQDLSEKAVVLEVGGVDNTFDELYRTIDIFTDIFSTYYFEQEGATRQ